MFCFHLPFPLAKSDFDRGREHRRCEVTTWPRWNLLTAWTWLARWHLTLARTQSQPFKRLLNFFPIECLPLLVQTIKITLHKHTIPKPSLLQRWKLSWLYRARRQNIAEICTRDNIKGGSWVHDRPTKMKMDLQFLAKNYPGPTKILVLLPLGLCGGFLVYANMVKIPL